MSNELITQDMLNMVRAVAMKISRRFCKQYGSDVVEEMTSDGFLALVQAARAYAIDHKSGTTFTGYAFIAVRNRILAKIGLSKHHGKRSTLPRWYNTHVHTHDSTIAYHRVCTNNDPTRPVIVADEIERINRLIDKELSTKEADAIRLYYLKEMNGPEIGKLRGYSSSNSATELVRIAVHKIRRSLRKEVES
jgi:RNA polymerase sigma factor (sigma-70 family)